MNKNNIIILAVIAVVVVGGISFYGGMKYGQMSRFGGSQFTRGGGQQMPGINRRIPGNIVAGEVLSKDANGITVKLAVGGSKIVLFSASTTVAKSTTGTIDDLVVGTQVMIVGTTNTDGSVTAQNVQIRPEGQPTMMPR